MGIRYIWGKYNYTEKYVDDKSVTNRRISLGAGIDRVLLCRSSSFSLNSKTGKYSYRGTVMPISENYAPSQASTYPCVIFSNSRDYSSTGDEIDVSLSNILEYAERRYTSSYWKLKNTGTTSRPNYALNIYDDRNGNSYSSCYHHMPSREQYPSTRVAWVSNARASAYPNYGVSGSYFYEAETQDNIDPTKVTIPDFISFGDTITITVTPSEDAVASSYGSISYRYEYSTNNGGSWQLINTTTSTTQQFTVPEDATRLKVRVRSSDNIGYTSADYVESKEVTISAAGSLAISGEDKDLGVVTSGIDFYVSSEDVTEALVTISTGGYSWKFTAQVGQTYTIDIFDLVNGSNTVTITATAEVVSGTLTATRTYQYAKAAQEFETGDAYTINQNGSVFYPLLVAEGVKLSDGRTLDVALSSIMERLKQIEQQAS